MVRGKKVLIFDMPPFHLEDESIWDKPYYIQIGDTQGEWINKGFARRCDASRWANKHGAKEIQHWEAC